MERFIICHTKKEHTEQMKKWRDGGYHVTTKIAHSPKGQEIHMVIVHGKKR